MAHPATTPSRGLRRGARAARLRLSDALDRDPLVPPRRLQFVGMGDFAQTGDAFLHHLRALAGLQATDRVLDVGCGIGRMARPLARFLDGGSYDGFDVNPVGVAWCQARYPEPFRFVVADLYNARYHPTGRAKASEYRFPYADESFDVVLATSVFTHLLEGEADHYLAEVRRVLAPDGRILATFFVLDAASRAAVAAGAADQPFHDPDATVAVVSDDLPEEAVAYDEHWVRARLPAPVTIHPGTWRGTAGPSYQDLVLASA